MDDGSAQIQQRDPVGQLFDIELESNISCAETEAEPHKTVSEHVLKIPCHIDNDNKPIDSLQDGLDISLKGEQEMFSEVLQRNAIF